MDHHDDTGEGSRGHPRRPDREQAREPDWRDQPPLTRALVGVTSGLVDLGGGAFGYSRRMTGKAETLLDESIAFLQDARPLLAALTDLLDSGIVDDARRALRILEATVTQVALVSRRLDQAATQASRLVPTIPQTQADIRAAREAAARLEGLVDGALEQLSLIPGVGLVRRGLALGRSPLEPDPEA